MSANAEQNSRSVFEINVHHIQPDYFVPTALVGNVKQQLVPSDGMSVHLFHSNFWADCPTNLWVMTLALLRLTLKVVG